LTCVVYDAAKYIYLGRYICIGLYMFYMYILVFCLSTSTCVYAYFSANCIPQLQFTGHATPRHSGYETPGFTYTQLAEVANTNSRVTVTGTDRSSKDQQNCTTTREATPRVPDTNPWKFPGEVTRPWTTGALSLSTSFSVESTDVDQDMANAVKTKMQLFNSSDDRGRCL